MDRRAILIAVALMCATGFSWAMAQNNPRKEIEAANAAFETAFGRGDAGGVAALYSELGQLYPPNEKIVEGRGAIERYWKAAMAAGIQRLQLKTSEVEGLGDTAVETGTFTLTAKDGGTLDQGKYIVIWKRVDGQWRLHRDCWNSSQPARK
jgi:uncharacterized protein (TIGR02246 family)